MAPQNSSVEVKITIRPAGGGGGPTPLVIDASGVPTSGDVGQPFSGALKVSGGTAPYSFALAPTNDDDSPSELPDGVSLNSDGSFSGTPTAAGDFAFTVDVSDAS